MLVTLYGGPFSVWVTAGDGFEGHAVAVVFKPPH